MAFRSIGIIHNSRARSSSFRGFRPSTAPGTIQLDGPDDVVPQILPGGQAHIDDGVVGQIGGQDDGVNDRVTQRDQSSGPQVWAVGSWSHWASHASASRVTVTV